MEQASEFAVSEAFSLKRKPYSQRLNGPLLDLETAEQLQDHDEAYVEGSSKCNSVIFSYLSIPSNDPSVFMASASESFVRFMQRLAHDLRLLDILFSLQKQTALFSAVLLPGMVGTCHLCWHHL